MVDGLATERDPEKWEWLALLAWGEFANSAELAQAAAHATSETVTDAEAYPLYYFCHELNAFVRYVSGLLACRMDMKKSEQKAAASDQSDEHRNVVALSAYRKKKATAMEAHAQGDDLIASISAHEFERWYLGQVGQLMNYLNMGTAASNVFCRTVTDHNFQGLAFWLIHMRHTANALGESLGNRIGAGLSEPSAR